MSMPRDPFSYADEAHRQDMERTIRELQRLDPGASVRRCTDPTCPCGDGDACNYQDTATTKAWPLPPGVYLMCACGRAPATEQGRCVACSERQADMRLDLSRGDLDGEEQ
jgi:hypothetical protein